MQVKPDETTTSESQPEGTAGVREQNCGRLEEMEQVRVTETAFAEGQKRKASKKGGNEENETAPSDTGTQRQPEVATPKRWRTKARETHEDSEPPGAYSDCGG